MTDLPPGGHETMASEDSHTAFDLPALGRRIQIGVRALGSRDAIEGVIKAFREHDLLIEAGAIAFRVMLALIPGLLFVFGALGFLGLDEVWRSDLAPEIRSSVSPAAFTLINDAVINVLTSKQIFWVTIGLGIAVWEVSGIVRASQQVLIRIYGVEEEDDAPAVRRFASSIAVGAVVGLAVLIALVTLRLGPILVDELLPDALWASALGFIVRWALALILFFGAIGLILRTAPDLDRPLHWVSFGAILVIVGWVVMTSLFGLYLTQLANYSSIYGNLATGFILLEYLYLLAIVFLGGLVVDALVEEAS